jgi:gliding motility-associated protein GldM
MAHGKETPRQKMIGMMYLVLTALLALNVQREVLNAFVIVDEGISKTVENFAEKNELMYTEFDKAAAQNQRKAGKWKDYAIQIKNRADNIYKTIQQDKIDIINLADGKGNEAIVNDKIDGMKVNSKDNNNIPAQYMVLENHGAQLKSLITEYREYCKSIIAPDAESVKAAIENSLDTKDPPAEEGKIEKWENEHFEHLPLIAVITIMSGLQTNVRNAESDMLRYLYTMIDAGSFKFNKLEATIIANSNYIIQGNEYNASVFLAAFDTTQTPSIYIGPYDSVKTEDGTYEYKLKSGFKYDSLIKTMWCTDSCV